MKGHIFNIKKLKNMMENPPSQHKMYRLFTDNINELSKEQLKDILSIINKQNAALVDELQNKILELEKQGPVAA